MKINFKKPCLIEVHCFRLTAISRGKLPMWEGGNGSRLTGRGKQDRWIFSEPNLSRKLFLRSLQKTKTQAVVAGLSNTDRNAGWYCGQPLRDM